MKIELIRSPIGRPPMVRKTLKALGLNKMHQVREVKDIPSVMGMVDAVQHMIKVVK